MKLQRTVLIISSVLGAGILCACQPNPSVALQEEMHQPDIKKAICVLNPASESNVNGIVEFTPTDTGMHVSVKVSGLTPGKHGFHVHEFGDCSAMDGISAGGHFNPEDREHGAPNDAIRHVGDLGNIEADTNGIAKTEYTDPMLSFTGENSIIGRAIIVHESADDMVSQPTGNAGSRVACGVIGLAKQ